MYGNKLNNGKYYYLNAVLRMLFGAQEERSIDQRITVEHEHRLEAKHASDSAFLVLRQRRQNEQPRFVVPIVSIVLHLQRKQE